MNIDNLNEKYEETLELPKILKTLSEKCTGRKAKELALSLSPSTDLYTVRLENARTSAALEMSSKYGTPYFGTLEGVGEALARCSSGAVLSLGELLAVKRLLTQINTLCAWYASCAEKRDELNFLFESLFPDKYLENKLEISIVSEDELSDEASVQLASIRKKISACEERIRSSMEKMIRSQSINRYLQENIVTMRNGRFVLPVRSEYKNRIAGFVHDSSASGSTLFIEPAEAVEANNDIRVLEAKELEEINRIIKALSYDCAQISEKLLSGYKAAEELDLYFSKANLAAEMKACEPEISDDRVIILNKARHPLIDKDKIVPISVGLGKDYETLVVTGPNTGGKTVLLKTVGLLTLMTMCGLLIPVSDGSRISVFKKILANIGDSQSIEMNLSTFSAHMGSVAEILRQADENSLVILDELGSGTDPAEGAALAVSIIEQLKNQGVRTITTTHYQELKLYALDTERVENASFEFSVETLSPTYRLIIGTPGKSDAFSISRRLGIPENIISYAKTLVSEENRTIDNILGRLERSRNELEKSLARSKTLEREMNDLKIQLENERSLLEISKENEIEKARNEAAALVRSVERKSQELIDELEKLRKEKDKSDFSEKAAEAKRRQKSAMNRLYSEANPVSRKKGGYTLPRKLEKGDRIKLIDSERKGVVIGEPDGRGNCFIQMGAIKTKVKVSDIMLDDSAPAKTKSEKKHGTVSAKGVQSRMTRRPKSELDIRGLTCSEGLYELDGFIDQAALSGIGMVTIIHGVGTGVLKTAVRDHLKRHPSVKSSRRGLYGEGEDGVTIVELK